MSRWTLLLALAVVACDPAPTPAAEAPTAPTAEPTPGVTEATADARKAPANAMELGALYSGIKEARDALDADKARTLMAEAMPLAAQDPTAKKAFQKLEAEIGALGKEVGPLDAKAWYTREAKPDSKAQLLVFWEVWCPHCRKHMPFLEETHTSWGSKGLEVIGLTRLTRGASEADARAFIKETGVTYAVGQLDGNALADKIAIRGVPAAAVVKAGVVVWRGHPNSLQDSTIEAILQ